jgi:polysaccharide export outer membrane protein
MSKRIELWMFLIFLVGVAFLSGAADQATAQTARTEATSDPVRAPFVPPGIQERTPAPSPTSASAKTPSPPPHNDGKREAGIPEDSRDDRHPDATGAVGLASTDAPERYKVGPEDVIHVSVWEEPDSSGDFKVSPQGTIHHLLLGEVGVAGHTAAEIAEILRAALAANYLRDPRVNVRVVEYHSQKVFVYGQVVHPGSYELSGETNILKLLVDAGGPTSRAADDCTLLHVRRTPAGEQVESTTIALRALLERGDISQNRPVSNGDVIFVPDKDEGTSPSVKSDERVFYVLGEVKNPGSYRFKKGASALSAILAAGGFSDYARPNKTKLVRGEGNSQKTRIVKMGELMDKGDRSLDVKLAPGDVLVVPRSLF